MGKLAAVWLVSCWLVLGCGGGSSPSPSAPSDPANLADGLGNEGHVVGTVALGDVAYQDADTPKFSPSLDLTVLTDNTALVAWKTDADGPQPSVFFSQMQADGRWSKPVVAVNAVPEFSYLTMGANGVGDAYLEWTGELIGRVSNSAFFATTKSVVRWRESTGWEVTPHTFATVSIFDKSVSLLDDFSIVSAAHHASSAPSANSGIWVVNQADSEQFRPNDENAAYNVYAPFSNASELGGLSVFVVPNVGTNTHTIWARLEYPTIGVQLAAVPILEGHFVCMPTSQYFYDGNGGFVVAAGASQTAVISILTASSGTDCKKPKMQLLRVETSPNFRVIATEIAQDGAIYLASRRVVIDDRGRAIATWCEDRQPAPGQIYDKICKWSQSHPTDGGGAWSTPENLFANTPGAGELTGPNDPEIAMSRNGHVVAAIALTSAEQYDPRVVVSRFSFRSGWAPWQKVANKYDIATVKVAINDAGTALVAYTANDMTRIGGKVQGGYSFSPPGHGPMKRVYVLKLPN